MTGNYDGIDIYQKMAQLTYMKKNMKDHAKLIYQMSLELLTYRIVKLCYRYVLCQYSFATGLTIYHMVSTFDPQAFLQHGSFCGIQIFVLVNLYAVITRTDIAYTYVKGFKFFPNEMLSRKDQEHVMFYIRISKIICCVNMALSLIAAFGYIFAPEYFNKKTYIVVWIRQTFPTYSGFMVTIVSLTTIPVALMMSGTSIALFYPSLRSWIQTMVLNEAVKNICSSKIPQKFRRDSIIYQRIVKQKIVICIMMRSYETSLRKLAIEILEGPIVMFTLGGVIVGASLMLEFLTNRGQDLGDQYLIYVGIACFAVAGFISANLYVVGGQIGKEASEKTYYLLTQLPWYDLDEDNRQIFFIFLNMLEKPLTMSTSLITMDFLLLVRIGKALYSLAAILAQFVSSSYSAL